MLQAQNPAKNPRRHEPGAKNPEKNREEIARKQHGNNPEKSGGTLARKNSRRFFLRIFFPAQKINGQNFFGFCRKTELDHDSILFFSRLFFCDFTYEKIRI